jgi:hypothetical protein
LEVHAGMGAEPDTDIMENGLEQLREIIARDRNHPRWRSGAFAMKLAGKTLRHINSRNVCLRKQRGWIPIGFVPMLQTPWARLQYVMQLD